MAWLDQTFQATRGDPAENNNNDYQNENETTNGIEEGGQKKGTINLSSDRYWSIRYSIPHYDMG